MYLASPRASPSWTSLTGREKYEDSLEHVQTAGRQSVVDEKDKDLGFADSFYGWLGRFTDT
jgi:hypothetical protein